MIKIEEIANKKGVLWIIRWIKYNIVGSTVFVLNLGLYYLVLFPIFKENGVIPFAITGSLMEYSLIAYLNKTKRGKIFESCPSTNKKSNDK